MRALSRCGLGGLSLGSARFGDRRTPGALAGIATALVLGLVVLVLAGSASATHDVDGDLIAEEIDNCPGVFNPDQYDHDADGRGSTCDDSPGLQPNVHYFNVYFRDQNGRQTPCVRIRFTIFTGTDVWQRNETCSPRYDSSAGSGDWHVEIEQLSPPQGCTGGLTDTLRVSPAPGTWRPLTVTYRCGTTATPAPQTFRDTFAAVGQTKPHAVKITAATPVSVITVKWTDRRNRFDLSGIQNILRTLSASPAIGAATPAKLKITRLRTATSLTVRIEKLKPGSLKFKVVSTAVKARAVVVTRVSRRAR